MTNGTRTLRSAALLVVVLLAACRPPMEGPGELAEEPGEPEPSEALAVLRPTASSQVSGTLRFTPDVEGLTVVADLTGLDPARAHAAHIHVLGDCTAPDATSAGGHFNFEDPGTPDPDATRIVGNVGEFTPAEDGTARDTVRVDGATLDGATGIVGRSVVIHASGNEPGPPPGSQSGARVACGVIGVSAWVGS